MLASYSEHNVGKTFCISRTYFRAVEEMGVKSIVLAAPSFSDLTQTLLYGDSGLMNAYPENHPNRPNFSPHNGIVTHPNGCRTRLISSESPQRARGANTELLLADEVSSWVGDAQEFFHNLMYGLRLGISQAVLVTTPKANPLMIELIERAKDPNDCIKLVTGSSFENEANLSKAMIDNAKRTSHTKLGRQEIYGELILRNDDAAFTPDMFEDALVSATGEFHPSKWVEFCIGCDPSGDATSKSSDKTGIVVAVLTESKKVLIVEDATGRLTGQQSVDRLAKLYYKYEQFCSGKITNESNGVGSLFKSMFKKDYPFIPIRDFPSSTKKYARAISTAHKYETGIVFHDKAANLVDLVNEGISWTGKGKSPDIIDALGFAVQGLIDGGHFMSRKKFIL